MEGMPCERVPYTDTWDAPSTDRLSALPDDVILHIKSFMNAREVVQTCVLCQRWRDLWRRMPCINAEFFDFSIRGTESMEVIVEDEVLFKRFVNRLLELRDPTIVVNTLWLRYSRTDDYIQTASAEASQWVSYAIQKQAWSVELVAPNLPLEIDYPMFTSHYLRRVGLCNVELVTKGFFKQLEMGCPVLEELNLDTCTSVMMRFAPKQ